MSAQPKYFQQTSNERSAAPYIPYSSHVSPNTIVTKDGDFVRTWRVGGISFETTDPQDILIRKEQLNTLYRSIGSNHVALWSHNVRRRTTDRLDAPFNNDFCRKLNDKYYDSFTGYRMMANELYLTLVYRPNPGRLAKAISKSGRRKPHEILNDQKAAIGKLDELAYQVEASMRRYDLEELRTYEDDKGAQCSEMLTFLHFLVTGEWQKVRVPKAPLNEYIGNAWIFAGTETIELRTPTRVRYAQGLDFKDYTSHTEPGLLNGLMYEDYEYVITQSFSFLSRRDGKEFLARQQKQLANSEDGSATQIQEMTDAIDELTQGQFSMGQYHFSLMIFGDSVEEVVRNRTSAMAIVQDLGFIAALVNTATDACFFAQLPCNWRYRPRVAGLTSRNFAGLCSMHNFAMGKRDDNPWGQAVTLLKTPSGQPLYFNFHFTRDDEDAYDKKVLGNTRIIGQSGSGKTVLMGFLLAQSQKYRPRSPTGYTDVFFDKDRGAELVIRRVGGKYLAIKNSQPTGFNPFQMEPTEDNISFLEGLVKVLASDNGSARVSASDEIRIGTAIRTVMRMPAELRRISTLLQNITEGTGREERENSLVKRLSKWCADDGNGKTGALAWVLDCPRDDIDFTTHSCYGFDGTDFLDNEQIRTPIAMYLLHRMEGIIDGRRFIYWMDEAWKWVDDAAFAEFAGNKQLTIRKQNGLGVFATQMPSSLLNSKIASQLVQQCATEIYLPNPKADFHEYTDGFKVSESEFEIIKSLQEDSRMFLVKQGHQSAIARLDFGAGFDDELAILSGSSDNTELLDEIMAEVGEDPDVWEPIFHQRRKERVLKSKGV